MINTAAVELHRPVIYKNQHAIDLLASDNQLTREQIELCFNNGAVWLESDTKPQRLYDAQKILKPGQKIHCYCNATTLADCPLSAELIADYKAFSIWNKPSGMLCQGSKWGDHWALYRWIKQNYWPERESYITHRLDRFTSGLVIVAHTEASNKQFHRLFENRLIKKTYRAKVSGLMKMAEQLTVETKIDNRNALSQIEVIDIQQSSQQSLVIIKPQTGRKHQIRRHLAEIGHPVINDRNYGQPPFEGDLKLQASALEFINPLDNKNIQIMLQTDRLLSL